MVMCKQVLCKQYLVQAIVSTWSRISRYVFILHANHRALIYAEINQCSLDIYIFTIILVFDSYRVKFLPIWLLAIIRAFFNVAVTMHIYHIVRPPWAMFDFLISRHTGFPTIFPKGFPETHPVYQNLLISNKPHLY